MPLFSGTAPNLSCPVGTGAKLRLLAMVSLIYVKNRRPREFWVAPAGSSRRKKPKRVGALSRAGGPVGPAHSSAYRTGAALDAGDALDHAEELLLFRRGELGLEAAAQAPDGLMHVVRLLDQPATLGGDPLGLSGVGVESRAAFLGDGRDLLTAEGASHVGEGDQDAGGGEAHIINANPTAFRAANLDRPGLPEHLSKGLRARFSSVNSPAREQLP